jgi:hypothetical protein
LRPFWRKPETPIGALPAFHDWYEMRQRLINDELHSKEQPAKQQ